MFYTIFYPGPVYYTTVQASFAPKGVVSVKIKQNAGRLTAAFLALLAGFTVLFSLYGGKAVKKYAQPLLVKKAEVSTAGKSETGGSSVTLKTGDCVEFGSYNGEPVCWQVIDIDEDGVSFLFSERILCFKAFDAAGKAPGRHEGADVEALGSNSWRQSTLRQWLNSREQRVPWSHCPPNGDNVSVNPYAMEPGFLNNNNFAAAQIGMIEQTEGDFVFLLTEKQMKTYFDATARIRKPTVEAVRGVRSDYLHLGGAEWYWTKSPNNATRTGTITVVRTGGFYKSVANDGLVGVCPALRLRSGAVRAFGGDGSTAAPYRVTGGKG